MRKMKDSGIEWVGKVPEDWEISLIGNEFKARSGRVSDSEYQPLSVTMLQDGVVPQLDGVAKSNARENRKLVLKNDFVINSRSDRRMSCGVSKYDGSVSLINIVLKPSLRLSPGYTHYLLKNQAFADEFFKWGHGIVADLWTTGWEDMKNISIALPMLEEQHKISNLLDEKVGKVDELISLQEKEIEKLNEYKKSLITKAVTKGLDPNAKMKDSGIEWVGEIPENWTVLRLKNIGETRSGIANKKPGDFGFGYPFVTYKNVYSNFVLDVNTDEKVNSTLQDRKIYNIKYGDVFFTGSSETIDELGFSSVALQDFENAVFNGFTIRFRPSSLDGYNPEYMKYLFRSEVARGYLSSYDNSITRSNLSQSRLKDLVIVLPKEKEQKKISYFLDEKVEQINSLIKIKQQKMEKLKEYKKSLIYEYVTGKKQVI